MRALLLIAIAAVALSGCYGSTEPATEIGEESARLNAQGTADNGPARGSFRYRLAGDETPDAYRSTLERQFPAGASGPFSEVVTGLRPEATYEFQACGRDVEAPGAGGCAQPRTFTTAVPSGDRVIATYSPDSRFRVTQLDIDARSGPSGADPRGSLSSSELGYRGFVTCLRVVGNRATVGAVGQVRSTADDDPAPESALFVVEENSAAVGGTGISQDANPPDCSTPSSGGYLFGASRVYVHDAP